MRHQIEYYFSADNLGNDIYLRRKMDAQGYIPLSSIAAFNRVKSLSQDAELIVAAVKNSTELELATIQNNSNFIDIANILVRPKTDPLKWPLSSPESTAQTQLNPDVPEFIPKTVFNSNLVQPSAPQQARQQQAGKSFTSAPQDIVLTKSSGQQSVLKTGPGVDIPNDTTWVYCCLSKRDNLKLFNLFTVII